MISDRPDPDSHNHSVTFAGVIFFRWAFRVMLAGLLLTWSCNQQSEIRQEALYGNWDIVKAVRNGRETPYLRGGYFIIEPNGYMTINITGAEEKGPFKLNENAIRLNDEKDFIVASLQQDSMAIRFMMNPENTFLFYLSRKIDESR